MEPAAVTAVRWRRSAWVHHIAEGGIGATAAALLVLAALTRLPGLLSARMFNVDESYLTAMGLTMSHGGRLYVDAVDRKPPLLPWMYSLAHAAVGSWDLQVMRALAVVMVAAAGVVAALIVRRLGGTPIATAVGGALVVLGTASFPPGDGQAANFELFALLPATAAMLVLVLARTHHGHRRLVMLAGAGALIAVAGMIKQPLLIMLAPLGREIWVSPRRLADSVAAGSAVVATMVAVAIPFGLGSVWRWAWVETTDYLDGHVGGIRVAFVLAAVLAVVVALHAPSLAVIWSQRRDLRGVDPLIWWWLGASALAVIPGFRFIIHYFQLLVPPVAVLAGLLVSHASPMVHRRILATASLTALVCTMLAALPFADAGRVNAQLAREIDRRTTSSDRILVWGALPEVYAKTARLPAQPFLSVGYVTGKWSDRNPSTRHTDERAEPFRSRWNLFNRHVRAHPPKLVLDTTSSGIDGWASYGPARYSFGQLLDDCYQRQAPVSGMVLWELKDPACVRDHRP